VIAKVEAIDLRFPTSRSLDGSDAMNTAPDYSAAYCILHTAGHDQPNGHGFTFTIGRGNELCVEAIRSLAPLVTGLSLEEIFADCRGFWRLLADDDQLRWLGPEKGVLHLATAAIVNAVWDLKAKVEAKPLWRVLHDLPPADLVACIDFRYLDDALAEAEAVEILERAVPGREDRLDRLAQTGLAAYTTSAGWMGYPDEKIRGLAAEAIAEGWTAFKLKVGNDPADDLRRARLLRELIGPDALLMLDANQVWDVPEAIERVGQLAEVDPWWIEEPTSPDDVLGHAAIAEAIAPIRVATGEHVQNRVIFKQLLQAGAIGFCQIDACRVGGVNEVLAVLLLAAKFDVPVCPHAGGVGLCELVQHLAAFDQICLASSLEGRVVEYVGHLHEHFVDPVRLQGSSYVLPSLPGYSAEIKPSSRRHHRFPDGEAWLAPQ
jgi:L-fuconate dehydratase